VRSEHVGIEGFDSPAGSLYYATEHGVFSWVPAPPARERLLAVCGHVLSERGIGYVMAALVRVGRASPAAVPGR
jgi:hypothetical protein